jgi:hypothetical protein
MGRNEIEINQIEILVTHQIGLEGNRCILISQRTPKMTKQLTGTSSRLGEAFALNILAPGDCVIATAGYEVQDQGRQLQYTWYHKLLELRPSNWMSEPLETFLILKHVT